MKLVYCSVALSLALAFLLPTVQAEVSPEARPITAITAIQKSFPAMCRSTVLSWLNTQQSKMPFMDMNALTESACECSSTRFFADNRISELLKLSEKELDSRTQAPNVKPLSRSKAHGCNVQLPWRSDTGAYRKCEPFVLNLASQCRSPHLHRNPLNPNAPAGRRRAVGLDAG